MAQGCFKVRVGMPQPINYTKPKTFYEKIQEREDLHDQLKARKESGFSHIQQFVKPFSTENVQQRRRLLSITQSPSKFDNLLLLQLKQTIDSERGRINNLPTSASIKEGMMSDFLNKMSRTFDSNLLRLAMNITPQDVAMASSTGVTGVSAPLSTPVRTSAGSALSIGAGGFPVRSDYTPSEGSDAPPIGSIGGLDFDAGAGDDESGVGDDDAGVADFVVVKLSDTDMKKLSQGVKDGRLVAYDKFIAEASKLYNTDRAKFNEIADRIDKVIPDTSMSPPKMVDATSKTADALVSNDLRHSTVRDKLFDGYDELKSKYEVVRKSGLAKDVKARILRNMLNHLVANSK